MVEFGASSHFKKEWYQFDNIEKDLWALQLSGFSYDKTGLLDIGS